MERGFMPGKARIGDEPERKKRRCGSTMDAMR